MSCSTLYSVFKTKASCIEEYRNGHGSAPMIWRLLNERYLGGDKHGYMFGDMKPLWNLAGDQKVPEHLRITHAFTFDYSICKPDNVDRLIAALRQADTDISQSGDKSWSHFESIAKTLEGDKPDPRMIGYGLGCTSVSDEWESFNWPLEQEPWDIFEEFIDAE